jgi:hypothetical protein
MDKVRALRIIEYVGDREWVENTIRRSINGTLKVKSVNHPDYHNEIRACTFNQFPDILESLPDADYPSELPSWEDIDKK